DADAAGDDQVQVAVVGLARDDLLLGREMPPRALARERVEALGGEALEKRDVPQAEARWLLIAWHGAYCGANRSGCAAGTGSVRVDFGVVLLVPRCPGGAAMEEARIELLQRMPVFGGIRAEILRFLLGTCPIVEVPTGEYFFRERDPADAMFVLEAGKVVVVKSWRNEEYLLHALDTGDC